MGKLVWVQLVRKKKSGTYSLNVWRCHRNWLNVLACTVSVSLCCDPTLSLLWHFERWHLSPRHYFDLTETIKRPGQI